MQRLNSFNQNATSEFIQPECNVWIQSLSSSETLRMLLMLNNLHLTFIKQKLSIGTFFTHFTSHASGVTLLSAAGSMFSQRIIRGDVIMQISC